MIKKGTKLYSIFWNKCPQCQKGDFFVSHPYNLKKVGDIYQKCTHCELSFSKEPGFYYGAMYVSYGLSVAVFLSLWVAKLILGLDIGISSLFIGVSVVLFLASPYIYHLSKIIWANMFFTYKGQE